MFTEKMTECKINYLLGWCPPLFRAVADNQVYNLWKQMRLKGQWNKVLQHWGSTTFQFLFISMDIRRLSPSPTFPCDLFIDALNLTPNWSRCSGQIVKSWPPSSNKPTRAGISSFSNEAQVWATKICLRWALISLEQELRGRISFPPG